MKKINDIAQWQEFFTFLNAPYLDSKEKVLSSMIKFKHGERILYQPSLDFLESDIEAFALMIRENFIDKWEKDYKALALDYDILYSNCVIYDENIDENTTTKNVQTLVNQGTEDLQSDTKDDNAKNAFDDISNNSPVYSSVGKNKRLTTSKTDEENKEDMTGTANIKKGYVKRYSNGTDGANAIEKDIAARKTRYIELVLRDIVDYITLSIY